MEAEGYRNALSDLSRFGLIVKMENTWNYVGPDPQDSTTDVKDRLWNAARSQNSIICAIEFLESNPSCTGAALGAHIDEHFGERWSKSSKIRNGNTLKGWAEWILDGEARGTPTLPSPKGRGRKSVITEEILSYALFLRKQNISFRNIAKRLGIRGNGESIRRAVRAHESSHAGSAE